VPFRHSSQPVTSAHWSKDFVEHLRTVHLALIATAAALIVVALTTKPYSTEVAKNELHKILELKKSWSPKSFLVMKKGNVDASPISVPPNPNQIGFDVAKQLMGRYQVDNTLYLFHLDIPENPSYVSVDEFFGPFDYQLPKIPDTLAAFKHWWDELDQHKIMIYFPKTIEAQGTCQCKEGITFFVPSEDVSFIDYAILKGAPSVTFGVGLQKEYGPPFKLYLVLTAKLMSENKAVINLGAVRVVKYEYTNFDTENLASYMRVLHSDFDQFILRPAPNCR
jgi:hypothetical protein